MERMEEVVSLTGRFETTARNTSMLKIAIIMVIGFLGYGCASNHNGVSSVRPASGKAGGSTRDYGAVDAKLLKITAYVDGSGRFIFTNQKVRHEHRNWEPPVDVSFGGEAWSNLAATPAVWRMIGSQLNLREAKIVSRKGRDIIALEHTAEGFDLYFCDSPNGGADYEVTIAIPRLK